MGAATITAPTDSDARRGLIFPGAHSAFRLAGSYGCVCHTPFRRHRVAHCGRRRLHRRRRLVLRRLRRAGDQHGLYVPPSRPHRRRRSCRRAAASPFRRPTTPPAVRLTNASDCGGSDCVQPVGYSYWSNINNHAGSDTMLVFLGLDRRKGGGGPTLFSYNKHTGDTPNLGPLFRADSPYCWASGRRLVFQRHAAERALHERRAAACSRYDVRHARLETVFDVTDQLRRQPLHLADALEQRRPRALRDAHDRHLRRRSAASSTARTPAARHVLRQAGRLRRVPGRQERPLAGDQGERRRRQRRGQPHHRPAVGHRAGAARTSTARAATPTWASATSWPRTTSTRSPAPCAAGAISTWRGSRRPAARARSSTSSPSWASRRRAHRARQRAAPARRRRSRSPAPATPAGRRCRASTRSSATGWTGRCTRWSWRRT